MEQVATSYVKNTFDKVGSDLKTFKAHVWAHYLSILVGVLLIGAFLGFTSAWWCNILFIVAAAFILLLEIPFLFKCFEFCRNIQEKLKFLENFLFRGACYLVLGVLMCFGASGIFPWIDTILLILCGCLYLFTYVKDKFFTKTEATAPIV
ncbi:hypothetical protein WA158_005676 [Blastocystis sp. Blastoise]